MPLSFNTCVGETLNVYFLCNDRAPIDSIEGAPDFSGRFWVGFRYADPQVGSSIAVEAFCDADANSNLEKTGFPSDIGARWVFRSGVIDDLPALVLSEGQVASLNLPSEPEWLHFYRSFSSSSENLLVQGRRLNSMGRSVDAIPLLEQAWQESFDLSSVAFELLFAFNATGTPQKTLEWVGELSHDSPVFNDALVWREIGFAFANLEQYEQAIRSYRNSLGRLPPEDSNQRAEVAYNAGIVAHQAGDVEARNQFWNIA